jgi:hypothetical protein
MGITGKIWVGATIEKNTGFFYFAGGGAPAVFSTLCFGGKNRIRLTGEQKVSSMPK